VVNTKPVPPLKKCRVEEALKNFEGEMEQVPPMYSALRFRGKRLYQLAREGREVERRARKVCVRSLTLREFSPPVIGFEVLCSSGTYVRTLCHDLGRLLGCGAHLSALERTSVGPFRIEQAHTLEAIEELALTNRVGEALISMDEALSFLPAFTVREEYIERVLHGAPVLAGWASGAGGRFTSGDMVRVKSPDSRLLAVGEAMLDSEQITLQEGASHALKMKRVLVTSSL
jgi:tRNA pseudouridine55 synthase